MTFGHTSCTGPLVRVEMEAEGVSVLEWFSQQKGINRFYWSSRNGDEEAAGVGEIRRVCSGNYSTVQEGLRAIRKVLESGPEGVRYYGGMCFDPEDGRAPMEEFGRFRFLMPRVELRRSGKRTVLAVTGEGEDTATLRAELEALAHRAGQVSSDTVVTKPAGRILERRDVPDEAEWTRMVNRAIKTMRDEGIGKIVLSRKSELTMSKTVDAGELLERMQAGRGRAFDFCFEFGGRVFAGSSPECLYRRIGRRIFTEAMAGTCAVGKTEQETENFRAGLLASEKEVQEHRYVFDDVRGELEKICDTFEVVSERDVLTLSHVQHFVSRFEGSLKKGIEAAEIIEALHPTAAVGGCPQQAALEQIRRIERDGRGWYAGPVGWLGRDGDEFAVGIRSCSIEGQKMRLYAGAGIVGASDAAAEWKETEAKMRHFIEVLG